MDEGPERFSAHRRSAELKDAADWFARWQSGNIDEAAFVRWRDASPSHALAFARVTAAWESASECNPWLETPASPVLNRRRLIQGGMAAVVVLTASSGLVATRAYAWDEASTGVGETRKLRLPDGSIFALNTDSALSWRFSSRRRELWLERGEVALDLQSGPAVRLRTDTSSTTLEAGRFNARLRGEALDLMVLRGRANHSAGNGASGEAIGTGQRLLLSKAGAAIEPVSSDMIDAVLAWQSGEIVFLDTPLAQAAAEYNRYLPRKIIVEDSSIGAIRVGGRFLSSDPGDFLHAVSVGLGVRVRVGRNGYLLYR